MTPLQRALAQIRAKPGMYFGSADPAQRLMMLEYIISGYNMALVDLGAGSPDSDFPMRFSRFCRRVTGWSLSAGPALAVLDHSNDAEEAWNTYWRLIDEFFVRDSDGRIEREEP